MSGLSSDLTDALRSIVRTPLLAAVIIGSLAVGIGLNTVVFSWVQARILRPLPGVADGGNFYGVEPQLRTGPYPGASWLEYQDLRRRLRSIPDLIAFRITPLYVGEPAKVERVSGVLVSPNYFSTLGLRPVAGRFPDDAEMQGAGQPVAVISYGLWQKQFGGAASAIGGNLRVNGRYLTVIGVTPREFQGTVTGLFFDAWLPAALAAEVLNNSTELIERTSRGYLMMGRLSDRMTAAHAQEELDIAMSELARAYPETSGDVRGEISPAWNLPRGPSRMLNTALGVLQGAMLLVLIAVCGNIANLALARGSARHRELGIRMAIGANRSRIVRLLLAETMVMAAAGTALGVAIAVWGTKALSILPLTGVPLRFDTTIDGQGLLVAIALGLLAGLVIGAAPALHMARVDPQVAFRAGAGTGRSRLRDVLMAAQAGLALMVLIATGISLSSYLETRDIDPGFEPDGVLLAAYDLSGRPRTAATMRTFNASLLEQLRAVPGVEAAAIASSVPLDIHGLANRNISVEGRARTDAGTDQTATNTVTAGYFDVMGLAILDGRDFSALDAAAAPLEAVANEEFVRRFLPGGEALGRRVTARARAHTIVGVVQDSVANAFGEPPTPVLYFSYRDASFAGGEIHVRARTGSDVTALGPALRTAMAKVDGELPLFNMRTLTDHVETNLFLRRIPAQMFAVIGPMLLLLMALGIYAVVSYSSSLRRVEIGVRLAMGAVPRQILVQFVREGLTVIAIGGVVGWAFAFGLSQRFVSDAAGPGVFIVVPLILLAVSATACWVPARVSSRLDPTEALRPD